MSKTDFQYTPGPWHAHEGAMDPDYVYIGEDEGCDEEHRIICECYQRSAGGYGCPDATLIAAAPEMYELLCSILTEWPDITTDKELRISTLAAIDEVLRKARGDQK